MKLNLVKSSNFAANLASLLEFIIGFRLDKRIGSMRLSLYGQHVILANEVSAKLGYAQSCGCPKFCLLVRQASSHGKPMQAMQTRQV